MSSKVQASRVLSKYGGYNKRTQCCCKCNDCDGPASRCILQPEPKNTALCRPNTVHQPPSLDKYVGNPVRHVLYEIAEVFELDIK